MSEIIAFVLGYLAAWPSWFILIGLCLWSDYAESSGWTVFLSILFGVASYFLFNLSPKDLLWTAPLYVVIGVLWSLWRWKRRCDKKVALFMEGADKNKNKHGREILEQQITPSAVGNKERITTWVLTWPFGLVVHSCNDIFSLVGKMIDKYLIKAYQGIGQTAINKLPPAEDTESK